jgi:hypothetical protein
MIKLKKYSLESRNQMTQPISAGAFCCSCRSYRAAACDGWRFFVLEEVKHKTQLTQFAQVP